jgi:hypothetical protein
MRENEIWLTVDFPKMLHDLNYFENELRKMKEDRSVMLGQIEGKTIEIQELRKDLVDVERLRADERYNLDVEIWVRDEKLKSADDQISEAHKQYENLRVLYLEDSEYLKG